MTVTEHYGTSSDPLVARCRGTGWNDNHTPFDCPWISQIDDNLWQGGSRPGLRLPSFIGHVVRLAPSEGRYEVGHDVSSSLTVALYDDEHSPCDVVEPLARWVNDMREDGPVLVHCSAGMNRSGVVVARALMLDRGLSADEAIEQVRRQRSPGCLHNPAFVEWLRQQ